MIEIETTNAAAEGGCCVNVIATSVASPTTKQKTDA
jgi:hypothetical protein